MNRLVGRALNLGWVPVVGRDGWRPFGDLEPGDVVIFVGQRTPNGDRDYVKRVIAVPDALVRLRNLRELTLCGSGPEVRVSLPECVTRLAALKAVDLLDRWTVLNVLVQAIYTAAIFILLGWPALAYLMISSLFSVGLVLSVYSRRKGRELTETEAI